MPFGIRSATQIRTTVRNTLSEWSASYSTTDAKVQRVFSKMQWSEDTLLNTLTFGLDSYFKKKKIRQILKKELSIEKVNLVSRGIIDSHLLKPQERVLLCQGNINSLGQGLSWRKIKTQLREQIYEESGILEFIAPLYEAPQSHLDALASFLNGKRHFSPQLKKLLSSAAKTIAAVRTSPELLPLLPKHIRRFLEAIDYQNNKVIDEHVAKEIQHAFHASSDAKREFRNFKATVAETVEEKVNEHLGQNPIPEIEAQLKKDISRFVNCTLTIRHLGEKRAISVRPTREKTLLAHIKKIANSFEGSIEEKKRIETYIQVFFSQNVRNAVLGTVLQAIRCLSSDPTESYYFMSKYYTNFALETLSSTKLKMTYTDTHVVSERGVVSKAANNNQPVPSSQVAATCQTSFSIFLEKREDGFKITTDP